MTSFGHVNKVTVRELFHYVSFAVVMPAEKPRPLLNRSPRSRKSLAIGVAGPVLHNDAPARRKRAHSIAPGENLKMAAARRRSLLVRNS